MPFLLHLSSIAFLLATSFFSSLFAQNLEKLRAEADSLYFAEAYEVASKKYDAYLAHDTSQAEAFHRRGACFLNMEMEAVAIRDFQTALRLDPDYANSHYNLGILFEKTQAFEKAQYHFRQFSRLQPEDPDGYMRQGFIHAQSDQKDSVIWYLERAYALDSTDWRILQSGAGIYLYYEAYDRAERLLKRGISIFPEKKELYELGVSLYGEQDKYEEMTSWLTKAIRQFPKESDWYNERATSRLQSNTPKEALQERSHSSNRFAEIHSFNLPTLDTWASDPENKYYYEKLWNQFQQQPETMGLDAYFMLYYGQTLQGGYSPYGLDRDFLKTLQNTDYEANAKLIQQQLEKEPFNAELYYYLAVCHLELGQLDAFELAIQHYYGFVLGIMLTGDGKSYESAYIVASTHDEYVIMDLLGLEVAGQELHSPEGRSFDILNGMDEDKKAIDIYFNIEKPFGSLHNLFKEVDEKPRKKKKKRKKN